MKIAFTAETRPSRWLGVSTWRRVERITTLTVSAMPLAARSAIESRKFRDSPKPIMHRPKSATAVQQGAPGLTQRWKVGQKHGHGDRTDCRSGTKYPEALRSHVEDFGGEDGKQCHGAAEQHREQIQRQGAQYDRLSAHESDTRGQALDEGFSRVRRSLRGRVPHGSQRQHTDRHNDRVQRIRGAGASKTIDEASDRGSHDGRELPGRAAPRDRIGIELAGHQLRAQCGPGRLEKAPGDAAEKDHDIDRPDAAGSDDAGNET